MTRKACHWGPWVPGLLVSWFLLGCASFESTEYVEIGRVMLDAPMPASGSLRVRTNVGDVRVETGPGPKVEVEATVSLAKSKDGQGVVADAARDVSAELVDGTLVIGNAHLDARDAEDWGVSFVARVPAATSIEVLSGVGDVHVLAPCQSITVKLGVGDVHVEALDGRASLHTGTGRVELDAVRLESGEIESGTGALRIHARSGPTGTLEASSGTGDVQVSVGDDFGGDLALSTGTGSVRLVGAGEVRSSGAPFGDEAKGSIAGGPGRIHASTGTGDVDFVRGGGGRRP